MFSYNNDLEVREAGVVDIVAAMEDGKLEGTIIDLRQKADYDAFHLEHALSIPMQQLPESLDFLRKAAQDLPLIIHCVHGINSGIAVLFLKAQGVDNIIHVADGIAPLLDKEE